MKLLLTLAAALAVPAMAAPFNAEQLAIAAKAAADEFKAEVGQAAYDAIYGLQSSQAADGGRAKVFYRQGGQARTAEFFCHFHQADEIDCHAL